MTKQEYKYAGMFTTALRLVVGWTYFSAFWRRLIIADKLDPEAVGYIGEKFNHFLPNALGIKPIIEYLVSNPDMLWWAMAIFTIVEAVVGLFIMFGLFTRLMSVGVFGLAFGILLGSGWLGTTCLDEWQIGVLGVATGFTLFFTGGGKYSLDNYLEQKGVTFTNKKWFALVGSGELPFKEKMISKVVLIGSLLILGLTLFTNQVFHGGVWGDLHNLSVKPHVTITEAQLSNKELSFKVFRDEGADVYGSFLIGITLKDEKGNIIFEQGQKELSTLSAEQIENDYVAKVKTGVHSLILPLGARAKLIFKEDMFTVLKGKYTLELIDISGAVWKATIER